MLEKPELEDERIIACLQVEYGLSVATLSFLPLGADQNTAVYRAVTPDGTAYFVKLRCGEFAPASVSVPNYLHDQGMRPVIPPLATRSGSLWAGLPPFKLILYPYVDGRHGYAGKLSPEQWSEFGAALKQLHTARIPADLTRGIPREDFSSRWRTSVKAFLEGIRKEAYTEPIAAEMAAFLKARAGETLALVRRAEHCLQILQQRPSEFVLCHADIHGWNLLVDGRGALYVVDWDTLLFAPKERDLMFIGAGLADSGYTLREEEAMFYQGYGRVEIDPAALAYYRSERVIEDIAVFCEQIFSSDAGGADRKQALEYLKSNFLPGGTIEMAYRTEL